MLFGMTTTLYATGCMECTGNRTPCQLVVFIVVWMIPKTYDRHPDNVNRCESSASMTDGHRTSHMLHGLQHQRAQIRVCTQLSGKRASLYIMAMQAAAAAGATTILKQRATSIGIPPLTNSMLLTNSGIMLMMLRAWSVWFGNPPHPMVLFKQVQRVMADISYNSDACTAG